jgi:hypothetical protein
MVLPTFESYLGLLPADLVLRQFLDHSGQKRRILSSSLVRDAARQFATEKSLHGRFKLLSPRARFTCALVYLAGERGVPAPGVRGLDDELLSSFLVFAGRGALGNAGYYGFTEFEPRLAALCAETLVENAGTPAPGHSVAALPWHCLSDVIMCANLASLGMFEKTKKGAFSKAAETALVRFLHVSHDLWAGHSEADGPRAACVSLLLSYAVSRELLAVVGETCRTVPGKLAAWLLQPLDKRCTDFRDFAFASAPLWRRAVMEKLFCGTGRTWLSTGAFPDFAQKDAVVAATVLWLCGCLEVCKTGGNLAFTATARMDIGSHLRGLPASRVMLLPDFSAVLSQEVLPEELYWFTKVGALLSFDRVYKGAIQRDVINNSLSEGIDEKVLTDWLALWKAPHNVEETVKEWIREFSRIYLKTNASVVSFDEKATRQIAAYEPLRGLVTEEMPHRVFSIRRGREEEVRWILQTMGFDPRAPGETAFEARRAPLARAPDEAPMVTPMVSFEPENVATSRPVKAGKYGEKLKELDISDMFHVLDYAVLMGHRATFEYLGSPHIKAGMHTVKPIAVHKSKEPLLEAEAGPKKSRKKFLLKKITRIGVESA